MLGKVQTFLAVNPARAEFLNQLLKFTLKLTHAPDFPPHFLAWRWQS